MKLNWLVLGGVLMSLCMTSCFNDIVSDHVIDYYGQYQEDSLIIDDYLKENDIEAYDVNGTGVYISIYHNEEEGYGECPTLDTDESTTIQYVTTSYTGFYADGEVFSQTGDSTAYEFTLANTILGWQIALPEMSQGDSALIFIPSYWAYGTTAYDIIPANSVLIYDMCLTSFERR